MAFTYRQKLTKFDYSICLSAALAYLMIHQQDPVGLIMFDEKIRKCLPPKSRRTQLASILAMLSSTQPQGQTRVAESLQRVAAMIRHRSLLMIFSDLLSDVDEFIKSLHMLRYGGHDVIVFHVLDEAEVQFPYSGNLELLDPESGDTAVVDAAGVKMDYVEAVEAFRAKLRAACLGVGADYVPLDTSMPFDRALLEYLSQRKARF